MLPLSVRRSSVIAALAAAALFGAATPFAKQLLGELAPGLMAGLLYLGSGLGLMIFRLLRDRGWRGVRLSASEWLWLGGSIVVGGVLGPVLLMTGLTMTDGATASLLLNLEAVFTALLAWMVFKENAGARIVIGMLLIVAGGVVLLWPAGTEARSFAGAVWVAAACLCWGIDNNLTRKVSANDAVFLAAVKGLIAGSVNTQLALTFGATIPALSAVSAALLLGLLGYGVSLVLFVVALRGLGTARTGAYFSTAPFVGAVIALWLFGDPVSSRLWICGALMSAGVLLHLTERHAHQHRHLPIVHVHPHVHDEHHRHDHDFAWDGSKPHTHSHQHEELAHTHEHYPDIHHRHEH